MKKIILILLIFLDWTSFSQLKKNSNRILTYGMSPNNSEALELIAKEWGIEIYPVADCVVSQSLKDSIKEIHNELWLKMDNIHGIDSKKKFQEELLVEKERIAKVYDIFYSDKNVKKRKKEIYLTDGIVSMQQIEKVSKKRTIYCVILYTLDTSNLQIKERKPDLKIEVNLTEKKTKLIELK